MIDQSLAQPAHQSTTDHELVVDRIEAEIARLRDKRPALADRIDRAANILVTHLSCPRQRVIRVRVVRTGKVRFLVDGAGGAVYAVSPADWSCSCPDHHRRGGGICKHGLACYVLWRASCRPMRRRRSLKCAACNAETPRKALREVFEDTPTASAGERVCAPCARSHEVLA